MQGKIILNGRLYSGGLAADLVLSGIDPPTANIGYDNSLYVQLNSQETQIVNIYFKLNGTWIPYNTI